VAATTAPGSTRLSEPTWNDAGRVFGPASRLSSERGYTVIEFVLVAGLLAFVLGATLALLDKTTELMPGDEERAPAVREAQVGVHRMTRVLRQAYTVSQPAEGQSGNVVQVEVLLGGADRLVTFDCSGASSTRAGLRRCVQTVQPIGGGASRTQLVLDGVANPTVFTRGTRATLAVRVEVPAKGRRGDGEQDHRIVLDDGVFLRNVR
jgi:hypothetical protein